MSEWGAFGRTDAEWEADIHLGHPLELGAGLELNLLVDIFNVFNRQGETGRYTRYTFFEIDPLVCSSCGGSMGIVSVILEHNVITKILDHLARKGVEPGRGPPKQPGGSEPEPF